MSEVWLKRAVFFGLAGLLLRASSFAMVPDIDMWHEMSLFREALTIGWIPRSDMFSYTPTINPVVHHEWGNGALLYCVTVASKLGSVGLLIFKYALSAAIGATCYACARRQGASTPAFAFLAPIGIFLGMIGLTTIRAQVFTLLFLIVLIFLLEEDRRGRRWWIAAWLPVYVIWLNLHAGFLVGAGLFFFYILERFLSEFINQNTIQKAFLQVRHLFIVWLAMIFLVMINPYGFDYLSYLWYATTLDRTSLILEWRPLWQPQLYLLLGLFAFSLLVLIYSAAKCELKKLPGMLFLLVTAWMALRHVRHVSIYAVIWIAYVPAYTEKTELAQLFWKLWRNRKSFLCLFWVAVGVLGVSLAIHSRFWQVHIPTTSAEEKEGLPIYPSGVINYLSEQKFIGNVMTPFSAGAYVSWKLYPKVKVSMDGRYEAAYPPEAVAENVEFYRAKDGWQKTLTRYSTDAVLVPHSSPLDQLIEQSNQTTEGGKSITWRRVCVDDGFSLFMRSELSDHFPVQDRTGEHIHDIFSRK